MHKLISFLLFISAFSISGCVTSGYQEFYNSYIPPQHMSNVDFLKEGQEPEIYGTNDIDKDVQALFSRNYFVLGESSFNGTYEGKENVVKQAKNVGATIVILGFKYTNTETTSSALVLPTIETHSGIISGVGGGAVTYSGTSSGTQAYPYTAHNRRYDQRAVFLVKGINELDEKKYKLGLKVIDLDNDDKREIGQNTGCKVYVILDDSPAFKSNILREDIITAINNTTIKSSQEYKDFRNSYDSKEPVILTIFRNGEKKDITVKFD